MWLLEAANAEDAYRKAEANGKLIAQFGNDLLAEKPEAYQRVGLGEIKGSILHPSLVDVYRNLTFLGVKDFFCIGPQLSDGTELHKIEKSVVNPRLESRKTKKEDMIAFSPAGEGYGEARMEASAKFIEKYHWYMAEQIFTGSSDNLAGQEIVERMILIHANDPEEAFQKSLKNAAEWERNHPPLVFFCLSDLALIESAELGTGDQFSSVIWKYSEDKLRQYEEELAVRHDPLGHAGARDAE